MIGHSKQVLRKRIQIVVSVGICEFRHINNGLILLAKGRARPAPSPNSGV